MCLILFDFQPGSQLPLVVAANRDEFHRRPTEAASFWDEHPHMLAGRDLEAGGTWLGCTKTGRFAALTNFSGPDDPTDALSRGQLVKDFLLSRHSSTAYADAIPLPRYAGFNLLLFDGEEMVYTSNKAPMQRLTAGTYGLSNAELGAAWPKCVRGRLALQQSLKSDCTAETLLDILSDQHQPGDDDLPQRGRPVELERATATCFINGAEYGTRASTAIVFSRNHVAFTEQSFDADGVRAGRVGFEFALA